MIPIGNLAWLDFGYNWKFEYYTNYKSGDGTYYLDNVFTDMSDDDHFEEVGFVIANSLKPYVKAGLGTSTP